MGGSPDWVAIRSIRSISARRFVPIRSRFGRDSVDFGASFRADSVGFVAICRRPLGVSCRHPADTLPTPKARHKKARFLNRGIGVSYRKASRALNLPLVPLSNTRASARGVLRGLACRSFRFGALLVSRRVDSVVPIWSAACVAIRSVSARRFGRDSVDSTHRDRCRNPMRKHKKPDSSIGGIGVSYRKVSRALNLLSVPLSNTRASARGVLRGLARRSCIVMITSGRRHIVHYTLQNMRTHGRS